MSIKSIQKKTPITKFTLNINQLHTENIRKHPLAPKVQRVAACWTGKPNILPAADQRFFEVSRKFTRIGSRLQGMDHGYPWMGIVEICWNLLNQVRQVESNDSLPLEHSGTRHHSNDRSSWCQQGGCHLPLTLWDCHVEVTRRFLEFENNIEQLILTLLPRSKELGRIQQPGGYNGHLSIWAPWYFCDKNPKSPCRRRTGMVAAIHGCATGDVGNGEPAVMQIDDHPDPRLPTDPRGLEHSQNLTCSLGGFLAPSISQNNVNPSNIPQFLDFRYHQHLIWNYPYLEPHDKNTDYIIYLYTWIIY